MSESSYLSSLQINHSNRNDSQQIVLIKLSSFIIIIIHFFQDAFAEPGQDSRNVAGFEVVVIVGDVQDVPPIFTLAPPVTRLESGLQIGDKVCKKTHRTRP